MTAIAAMTVVAGSSGSRIVSDDAPCHATSAKYTTGKLTSSVHRVWPGPVMARTMPRLRPTKARITPGHWRPQTSCCSSSAWPARSFPAGEAAIARPFRKPGRSRTLSGVAAMNAATAATDTAMARETRELSSLPVIHAATSGTTTTTTPA